MHLAAMAFVAAINLRNLTVINRTDAAIFTLRIGHLADGGWSDDLLGFANVIDVSRGILVHVPVDPAVCTYDVQATLRGGAVVVVPSVDLCAAESLDIKPSST